MSAPHSLDGCSFCAPPSGELELTSDACVRIAVVSGVEVPGWVAVHPRAHLTSWSAVSDETGLALLRAMREVSRALIEITGDDRTYTYSMGEKKPHLHVLIGSPHYVAVGEVGRGAAVLDAVLYRTAVDVAASVDVAAALRERLHAVRGDSP